METAIHESVEVLASFNDRAVMPRRFRWRKKTLTITTLNLTYRVKEGETTYRYFSVSADGGVYLLKFNPSDLRWDLEEVYGEG